MKKFSYIIICVLSTIAICLSTWSLIRSYSTSHSNVEYTLYIGTNDKDTNKLEIELDDARSIVHNTLMDHFTNGFTIYDANGVWRNDNIITLEYTFVCVIENASKEDVYKAADGLIEKLNQHTILIVSNSVDTIDFYTGTNN